ncbi:MAG: TetR/AcrR family transcriptional regulator [Promethearchaeota archaeon]|nr:MAG: TetR/AcrR family transcriptional regulator [Candidatus Lokiarchaeota archaeon]
MIDKNSVVKVYGPYDFEKKLAGSPYVTLFFDKQKAKLANSNTEINLEDIAPHFFASKKFTFQELKIINESRLVWTENTRSRSKKKKTDMMEQIIYHGTDLFTNKEVREFSMRKLARKCDMTVGNLYAYVTSKRDLWYAITQRYFDELDKIVDETIQNNSVSNIELFKNIIKKFLKFSRDNYPRHQMMFFTKAPPPPKVTKEEDAPPVGRYEENFEEKKTLNKIVQVLNRAIQNEEIFVENPLQYTYFIFGVLQGNIIEGFEYGQRIINEEIKKGVQKTEEEWKILRLQSEREFDAFLLQEIDRCLAVKK